MKTIGKKLTLSFTFLVLLFTGSFAFGVFQLKQLKSNTEEILKKQQDLMTVMAHVTRGTLFHTLKVNQYVSTKNAAHLVTIRDLEKNIRQSLANLEAAAANPEEAHLVGHIRNAYTTYIDLSKELQLMSKSGTQDVETLDGRRMLISSLMEYDFLTNADALYNAKLSQINNLMTTNNQWYGEAIQAALVIASGLFLLASILSLHIGRSISTPIRSLVEINRRFAKGDLNARAYFCASDESGLLAYSFNAMADQLQELIENLEKRVASRTRELEEEQKFVSTVLDTVDALVVVLNRKGEFVRFNGACEKVTGYGFDAVKGKSVWDLFIPPEDLDGVKDVFQGLMGGDISNTYENYWITKRGDRRLIAWSNSTLLNQNGEAEFIVATGIDVTNQRKAAQALKQAKIRAEAANRAKGEFLANMSHEIRTPMNGVIGMTRLLMDTPLSPLQKEFAETLETSAASLLKIIDDILDFSKIDAGKIGMDKVTFHLPALMEEVLDILSTEALEKGLEFICFSDPELPVSFKGDPDRLRQVIVNLAGNAIKFTDSGEVSVRATVESHLPTAMRLRFTVSDTGIGVDENEFDRLFHSFTQVDSSTTRRYGGTGLGLAISKKIVELMGGEIGVNSKKGLGSIFWFTVPLEREKEKIMRERSTPEVSENTRFIAAVASESNAMLIRTHMDAWGLAFDITPNARGTLKVLKAAAIDQKPYAAALVDHAILSSYCGDLIDDILSIPECESLKLVVLSPMEAWKGYQGNLIIKKIHGYLRKPIKPSQLAQCLTSVIQKGVVESPWESAPSASSVALNPASALSKGAVKGPLPTILLVEDNLVNRKVALKILDSFGYCTDTAVNGEEAVTALAKRNYDIVLMDLQMPEMDGFQAVRHIRNPETAVLDHNIKIIAMTAHTMKGDKERCLEAGMDAFIAKPFEPLALKRIIDDQFGQTRQEQ